MFGDNLEYSTFNKPIFWRTLDLLPFESVGSKTLKSVLLRPQRFTQTTHVVFHGSVPNDIIFGIVRACPLIESVRGIPSILNEGSIHETVLMRQLLTRANDLLSQASVKFTSTDTCEWSFDKNSSNDTELAGSAAVLFESMEYRNKAVNRLREARALLSDALYLGIANNWGKYDKKKFAESSPDEVLATEIFKLLKSTESLMPSVPPIGIQPFLAMPRGVSYGDTMALLYDKYVAVATGHSVGFVVIVDYKQMKVVKVIDVVQLIVSRFGKINSKLNKLGRVHSICFLNGYLFMMTSRFHIVIKIGEDLDWHYVNSGLDWTFVPYGCSSNSQGCMVLDSADPAACPFLLVGPDCTHIVDPLTFPVASVPQSKKTLGVSNSDDDEDEYSGDEVKKRPRPKLPYGAKWLSRTGVIGNPVPKVSGNGKFIYLLTDNSIQVRTLHVARDRLSPEGILLQSDMIASSCEMEKSHRMNLVAVCYDGCMGAAIARPVANSNLNGGVAFFRLKQSSSPDSSSCISYLKVLPGKKTPAKVHFAARDGSLAIANYTDKVVFIHVDEDQARIVYVWNESVDDVLPTTLLNHFDGNMSNLKLDIIVTRHTLMRVVSIPLPGYPAMPLDPCDEVARADAPIMVDDMICHNGVIYASGVANLVGTDTPARTVMITLPENGLLLETTPDMKQSSISYDKIGTIEDYHVIQVKKDDVSGGVVALGLSATVEATKRAAVIDTATQKVLWQHSISMTQCHEQEIYSPDCTFWKGDIVLLVDRKHGLSMFNWRTSQTLGVFGSGSIRSCRPDPYYNFILGGASDSRHIGNYSAVLNDKGDTIQYNTPSECVSSSRKSDWSPDGKLFATGHAGITIMRRTGKTEENEYFARVINVERGLHAKGIKTVRGQESIIYVRFSPDGKWLGVLDGPSRPGWGLPSSNVLLRIYSLDDFSLRLTYDVGPLASAFCWHDKFPVLLVAAGNGGITLVPAL